MSEREMILIHVWGRITKAWAEGRYDDACRLEATYTGYEAMMDNGANTEPEVVV